MFSGLSAQALHGAGNFTYGGVINAPNKHTFRKEKEKISQKIKDIKKISMHNKNIVTEKEGRGSRWRTFKDNAEKKKKKKEL